MSEYKERLDAEIEKRLIIMEEKNYVFPKRLMKRDYIVIFFVSVMCFVLLILGAHL